MRHTPDPLSLPTAAAAPRPDPLATMAAEPWRYDFFAAMRAIEAFNADKPRLGTARRPMDEPLRLGQTPDLSFAPAALHAVLPRTDRSPPRVEVRFFGLFGPNGPLPLHLTEYARERLLHHGDATFARFADLFHHRLLLLFYRAWAQAQPVVSLDRPNEDRFADYVGSLIGIGSPTLRRRDAAPDHAKLFFAGLMTRQVRNADGLASLLSGFLQRPVRVEQFAGNWLVLQKAERSRVGRLIGGRRQPHRAARRRRRARRHGVGPTSTASASTSARSTGPASKPCCPTAVRCPRWWRWSSSTWAMNSAGT